AEDFCCADLVSSGACKDASGVAAFDFGQWKVFSIESVRRRGRQILRKVTHADGFTFGHHARVSDNFFKFADVTWPGVSRKHHQSAIRNSVDGLLVLSREQADEVLR